MLGGGAISAAAYPPNVADLVPERTSTTRVLAALLAAGLGGAAAAMWQRRSAAAGPVAGGRMSVRNLRLARLGAKSGGRYAIHRARRTFASAERAAVLDTEFELKTAEDVANELGNMKGAMMKIGQMASYIDTGLPDHVRDTLASLQSNAPPMSGELAAEQIKSELGSHPSELFAEWDPVPIASASIGQVHRAITFDDRAVAVKVQYPGVAEAVSADLGNADWLFGMLASMFPGLEAGPVVAELKERLVEELDYVAEARSQRYYAEFFDRHPFIHVPHVVDQYSTERVLTTELATGSTFAEVCGWSEHERNLAAETLFRFSFGSIYRLHAFNGDPHPGNYLFNKGGKVTFLDFGLVKRFVPAETKLFEDLIQLMVIDRDHSGFRKVVEDAGLLASDAPFTDEQVEEYFMFFYRYVMLDGPVTIDQEYASAGVSMLFDANSEHGELMRTLNVPPSFVVLQRITLGLMGLFARLEATANWRKIAEELWPFVSGPPSTPTGEAIEAWRQQRGQTRFGL